MEAKRATICLDPALHKALKIKAAETSVSLSELVNEAVRESIAEDLEDIKVARIHSREPVITYEEMLKRSAKMASHEILLRRSVERDLKKIPKADLGKVMSRISRLADDPFPRGSRKLVGEELYRVRRGTIGSSILSMPGASRSGWCGSVTGGMCIVEPANPPKSRRNAGFAFRLSDQ